MWGIGTRWEYVRAHTRTGLYAVLLSLLPYGNMRYTFYSIFATCPHG